MLGRRLVKAFEAIKRVFDPMGLLNPGKIVNPPRMDERSLFRYMPGYAARPLAPALDWSSWGGLAGAAEMCNNNGACRKMEPEVMCPSYRVTGDERDTTRGRANTLRLALTGQLGPGALESDEMYHTLELCVSCKACRRECPTGVDMARMKVEVLHQRHRRRGVSLEERVIGYLPRYAPWAARLPALANLRNRLPWLARFSERWLGIAARRPLPRWRQDRFPRGERRDRREEPAEGDARLAVLWVDTFNRYFEPENAHAAVRVLEAAGYEVVLPVPADGGRPICCGRTFLSVGLVDEARAEARRVIEALRPYVERGVPIVGLEPSCLLTVRDEYRAMLSDPVVPRLAERAVLLEELLVQQAARGGLRLGLAPQPGRREVRVAVHCCGVCRTDLHIIEGMWAPKTGIELRGSRAVVQGFGKVGGPLVFLLASAGLRVIAVSDITGAVYNPGGLDASALGEHVQRSSAIECPVVRAEPLADTARRERVAQQQHDVTKQLESLFMAAAQGGLA